MTAPATAPRCAWAARDPLLRDYHDTEWGVMPPTDNAAFELLTLEVFQAGLAWRTVLAKRPAFRRAFADFAIPLVAAFDASDVARLLNDPNIIRNRRKIEATIANARAVLAIIDEVGTFRGTRRWWTWPSRCWCWRSSTRWAPSATGSAGSLPTLMRHTP